MSGPAALRYPVCRSNLVGMWTVALALAGILSVATWCIAVPYASFWRSAGTLLATSAVAAFALWRWWHTEPGSLRFDGRAWMFEQARTSNVLDEFAPGSVAVVLDWQQIVLVCLTRKAHGRPRWIWLERRADPRTWHALRCALHQGSQRRYEGDLTRGVAPSETAAKQGKPV